MYGGVGELPLSYGALGCGLSEPVGILSQTNIGRIIGADVQLSLDN